MGRRLIISAHWNIIWVAEAMFVLEHHTQCIIGRGAVAWTNHTDRIWHWNLKNKVAFIAEGQNNATANKKNEKNKITILLSVQILKKTPPRDPSFGFYFSVQALWFTCFCVRNEPNLPKTWQILSFWGQCLHTDNTRYQRVDPHECASQYKHYVKHYVGYKMFIIISPQ